MIKSSNGYSKLKSVIVGRELNLNKRLIDFTFRHFYKSNLGQSVYDNHDLPKKYQITHESLRERIEDLDSLAETLESLGVEVFRPKEVKKVIPFTTPTFKSELSSASNVRDLSIIIDDKIIETPTYVRNRYFENLSLYEIFKKASENFKFQWIRPPFTQLTENTIDLSDWENQRDYTNISSRFEPAIDGAQFLRVNEDIIVNINSYNHYLGYLWVKSFFPEKNFHIIHIADNHIDGAIVQLNKDTFLVNPKYPKIWENFPEKFHPSRGYKYLYPHNITKERNLKGLTDLDLRLASDAGMDINVLSINPETVLVNKDALGTIKTLKESGFKVIEIQLRHSEVFAGGIHCSTLDLWREDERS